jgi:L-fuculose-phosphate aldolase
MISHASEVLVRQLIDVGQQAVERGLVLASGGNLSARVPGADHFLVTGAGTWLDQLEPSHFASVGLDGTVAPDGIAPSSEWKLHQRSYQERPDVNAVVHLHPQHSVLLDALGHEIRLLTLDHANYVRRVVSVPYAPNGSDELADTAAVAAKDSDCVILAHHGCSVLGDTVEMAFRRALNLEEAAVATYRCLLLGNATATLPPEILDSIDHA